MATYIETYLESIVQNLANPYQVIPVFDAEDANVKLDDVDADAVIYNAFLNGAIVPDVINKNYQSFSVLIWFLKFAESENEPDQLAAKNAIRDDIHEFVQRFQQLEAYKRYSQNNTLTTQVQEGYDMFDALLVGTLLSFTAVIDVFEDTCAYLKPGPVSVVDLDQSDLDNVSLSGANSTFRGDVVGATQGIHFWTFTLDTTTVSISGNSADALSAADIALLESIGMLTPVGNYSGFTFAKNPNFDTSLDGEISSTHQYDAKGTGALSDISSFTINSRYFTFTIDTSLSAFTSSNQFRIPLQTSGTYDIKILWGDDTEDSTTTAAPITHTYSSPGIYTINVIGALDGFGFLEDFGLGQSDGNKLLTIEQWGCLITQNSQFRSCANFTAFNTEDVPIIGSSIARMFRECTNLEITQSIENWDVSSITSLDSFAFNATKFNGDVSSWDVSNVTNMLGTFLNTSFNHDVSGWDVSNVSIFIGMFAQTPFNQDISSWDISGTTSLRSIFSLSAFNQDISSWDTSNITDMFALFSMSAFDQDISAWDVTSLVDATSFMQSPAAFSTPNYDAILISWAAQSVQNNVAIDFGDSQYSVAAAAARNTLITVYNWTITDGGPA